MGGWLRCSWAIAALVAITVRVAAAQVLPLGEEFQVNGYTTGTQRAPAVALDAAGNVIAVWQSFLQDGSAAGIFGRVAVSGAPIGPEFQVNVETSYDQAAPVVAAAPDGDFVVLWSSSYQDLFGQGVFGRRYEAGGAFGSEFAVNVFTFGDQTNPSVAMGAGGEFVAAWDSDYQDGAGRGVVARRFDAEGIPLGTEFQVNTTTLGDQARPAVAVAGTGDFVVVWTSFGQDGQYGGIFGRRFAPDGAPRGGEFQVNSYTTDNQFDPSVAADATGRFVVVWTSARGDGAYDGIGGRRYDAAGAPLGAEFQVNSGTSGAQYDPHVAIDAAGDFVVVWNTPLGGLASVLGRRFDADGVPIGADFRVTTYTTIAQYEARVARHPDGDFVATWAAYRDETIGTDVIVRRFTIPTTTTSTLAPCAVAGSACDDGDPCTADDVCSAGACAGQSFCTTSLPDDGTELPAKEPIPVEVEAEKGAECEAGLFEPPQGAGVAQVGEGERRFSKTKVRRVGKSGRVVLKLKLNKEGRARLKASSGRLVVVLRASVRSNGRVASLLRLLTLRR
jgi:hypothetical protein